MGRRGHPGVGGQGRAGSAACGLQEAKCPARVQQRKSKDLGPGPQHPRGSTLCCGDNKDEQRVTGLFHLLWKSTAELYSVRVFVTSGCAWPTPGAAGFGSWDWSPRGWLWVRDTSGDAQQRCVCSRCREACAPESLPLSF